jgi:NAD-dependent deacetylase
MGGGQETDALATRLASASAVVAFTGAGVSTESGIPDFRSPGGVWTRYDPRDFTFAKYVGDPDVRRRAWEMRREFWAGDPRPNPAHRALAALEQAGLLAGIVTQNIDGLHQAAGSRNVIELHGTSREVMCLGPSPRAGTPDGCGWTGPTRWAFDALDMGVADPSCPDCGGIVKSATVSFGQNLFPGVVEAAVALAQSSDLVVAVGSSLQVYPAAGVPLAAKDAGAALAIVNDEPTPLDDHADVVVRGKAGQVLPAAVAALPAVSG